MSAKPWYAWYSADYRSKTSHLSFVEDCAYRRLLDAYYNRGGPIESDRPSLYRIAGAMSCEEQNAVDKIATEFFHLNNNMLNHERADQEIAKRDAYHDTLSKAGKRGGLLAGKGRPKEISALTLGLAQARSQSHIKAFDLDSSSPTRIEADQDQFRASLKPDETNPDIERNREIARQLIANAAKNN